MAEEGTVEGGEPQAQPPVHIPLKRYLSRLKGTDEEIYSKLLQIEAGMVAKTAEAWRALLEEIKNRPAHPGHK